MSALLQQIDNRPFLSIILPVYNVAQYIPRMMKGLLDPILPHKAIEIIFIDDCSPDNCSEIIQQYSTKHPNIRLIRHSYNKKMGGARNTGLRAARGEYIFFADPDDELISEDFNKALDHLRVCTQKLDILMCDHKCTGRNHLIYAANNQSVMTGYDFLKKNEVFWAVWCCFFRREFLINSKYYFEENIFFEDTIWSLKTLTAAKKIQYLPLSIYYYHHNEGSVCFSKPTCTRTIDKIKCAINVSEFAEDNNHSEESKRILRSHGQLLVKIATKSLLHHSFSERNRILKTVRTPKAISIAQTSGGLLKYIIHYRYTVNLFMCFISPLISLRNLCKK